MEQQPITTGETGIAEELQSFIQYTRATQGQRFLNWLVDNIFMQLALRVLAEKVLGPLIVNFFPEFARRIAVEENTFDLFLVSYLFAIFNYLIYYTICEKAFKGYTIGKFLTGTRAISEDGAELSFKQTILRSLSRLVPFEAFSGFGDRPWHDSWTKTMVIKSR
jgi:uncharacterized RDD family membrane protein YckC